MNFKQNAIDLTPVAIKLAKPVIIYFEGYKKDNKNGTVSAYLDPVGIPTIGWGTIEYPNKVAVKMGDTITKEKALEYLDFELQQKSKQIVNNIDFFVDEFILAAFISFAYNAGVGQKGGKNGLVNKVFFNTIKNTGDTSKAAQILKNTAVTAKGVPLVGLVNRRAKEAELLQSSKKKKIFNIIDISGIYYRFFNI